MKEHLIRLRDGRDLSYAIYGLDSGKPVLYLHGTPSSRLEPLLLQAYGVEPEALLGEAGLRLIAIDRPGMGRSSPHRDRTFLSVAADAHELMEHLGIRRYPVLCWSGGGPYALASGYRYPEAVEGVYILCGFARSFDGEVTKLMGRNKYYFQSARYTPWLLEASMNFLRKMEARSVPPQWITGLPFADYDLLNDVPRFRVVSERTMKEACRNGAAGAVSEAAYYYRDFGLSLSAISCPVHYWWGTLDMSVIRLHAEAVEKGVKEHRMHYRQAEGHLSLYVKCFGEALQAITTAALAAERGE